MLAVFDNRLKNSEHADNLEKDCILALFQYLWGPLHNGKWNLLI